MNEWMIARERQKREHCTACFKSIVRKNRGSWSHFVEPLPPQSIHRPLPTTQRGVAFETRPSTKRPVNREDESQAASRIITSRWSCRGKRKEKERKKKEERKNERKLISSVPSVFLGSLQSTHSLSVSFFSKPFHRSDTRKSNGSTPNYRDWPRVPTWWKTK